MGLWASVLWLGCLGTLPGASSLLDKREGFEFFRDYVRKNNFLSLSIYARKDSGLRMTDRQRFVGSLAMPFIVHKEEEVQDFSADVSDTVLGITYMQTASDLQFLQKLSKEDLFRAMNWVIIGDPKTLNAEDVHAPYFPLNNKIVFAKWTDGTIELTETYQAAMYLPYIVISLGTWTKRSGFRIVEGDPSSRRTNLTGLHFRCVTLEQVPFVYLEDDIYSEQEVNLVKGYVKDIWDSLQAKFGFRYSCKRPSDGKWGSLEDGHWNGLIRELQDQSADVIVTSLDYTADRAKVVDFAQGTRVVSYRLVVQRPGLMDFTWTSFTSELGIDSWIVLVAMVVIAPLLLVFVSNLSPFEEWVVSLKDAYTLTLGALFFQGSCVNVSSTSSRVVFITIFLGMLLIYAHYTSVLVAQLTIASDQSTPFNTLQGLLNDGGYNLGFRRHISLEEYFRKAKASPYRELWDKIISRRQDNLPLEHSIGLQKVKKEKYVYLMEENIFNFDFYNECGLKMLPNEYFKFMTSIAFSKNSPYVKAFNYHLTKMRDSGVLERFWKRWQPPRSLCEDVKYIALSIDQTSTAFLVLLFGTVLSSIFCLPLEKILRSFSIDEVKSFRNQNKVEAMTN